MKNPVVLRRWREADADALFALASVPIVGQMARFPVHASKEESLRVIREIFCKPEFYAVTSREDGTVLGCISLHPATKGVDVYGAEELTIGTNSDIQASSGSPARKPGRLTTIPSSLRGSLN